MILAIIVLFVVMLILGAVVAELRSEIIRIDGDVRELTNTHNWNVKELEHRAERTQVIKVVEL